MLRISAEYGMVVSLCSFGLSQACLWQGEGCGEGGRLPYSSATWKLGSQYNEDLDPTLIDFPSLRHRLEKSRRAPFEHVQERY